MNDIKRAAGRVIFRKSPLAENCAAFAKGNDLDLRRNSYSGQGFHRPLGRFATARKDGARMPKTSQNGYQMGNNELLLPIFPNIVGNF